MKPDPLIFERCLTRLGVPACTALFIDDILVNVDAARALGMTAIHYTNKERDMEAIRRMIQLD